LRLSDWFDRRLVVPGSLLVLASGIATTSVGHWPLFTPTRQPSWLLVSLLLLLVPVGVIPTVLIPQRRRRQAAVAEALQTGRRTAELKTVLLRVRMLELVIVAVVFVLMVGKPF
jgi:uncharacterized membrane protein